MSAVPKDPAAYARLGDGMWRRFLHSTKLHGKRVVTPTHRWPERGLAA